MFKECAATPPERFWRYDNADYGDGSGGVSEQLNLTEYHLVRETPKGCWIIAHYDWMPDDQYSEKEAEKYKKWISKTSKRRHAYPTKAEALTSFIARKRRQLEILEHQEKSAWHSFRVAEAMDVGEL